MESQYGHSVSHVWEQLDQGEAYCLNCPQTSLTARSDECMNPWQFFDRKICLTVQDHEWRKACNEFERVGLHGVERFQAVKEIGPHQSFSHSERNILLDFYHSSAETLLHLEDDVQFRSTEHLEPAIKELPNDWDVWYLGANLVLQPGFGACIPVRHSEHLFKIDAAWTTHAIAYNKKCIHEILAKQPGFSERMFDNYLSDRLPELNAFVVAPMIAWQRPHMSLIWNRETDYNDVFEQSEEKLR